MTRTPFVPPAGAPDAPPGRSPVTPPAAAPRATRARRRPGPDAGGAPAERPGAPHDRVKPRAALVLDPAAVAGVEGLAQEVALLRASIRQLAQNGDAADHVKVLAELRHQVEALCTALKTQQALDGHDGDALAADLARALDELGDELGMP